MRISLLLIVGVLFFSCEEKIDFELNDDGNKRLVVEGAFTDVVRSHEVRLTYSSSFYQNEDAEKVSGATVTIENNGNIYPLTESTNGVYLTAANVSGVENSLCKLKITLANGEVFEAVDSLTRRAVLDSVTYLKDFGGFGGRGDTVYQLLHWGEELPEAGNRYMWEVWIDGELNSEQVKDISYVDDQLINGNDVVGVPVYSFKVSEVKDSADVLVVFSTITKDYDDFLDGILFETQFSGGLFSGPPANIPTNVTNGGLGFFRASTEQSYLLKIKK